MKQAEALKEVVKALKKDILSIYELMYFNNPISLVYSLRKHNLINGVTPKREDIEKIIKRLIIKRDRETLRNIVYTFTPDTKINNFTNNQKLWSDLQLNVADYKNLFDKYLSIH
jgi:hypothetical protein